MFKTSFRVAKFVRSLAIISLLFAASTASADDASPLQALLYSRHLDMDQAKLEEFAGGADALIEQLMAIQPDENTPPYFEIRCVQILMRYADRPEVMALLSKHLQSANTQGLARSIALHIDRVDDKLARRQLARVALSQAQSDKSFEIYARSLKQSKDRQVRALALDALGE